MENANLENAAKKAAKSVVMFNLGAVVLMALFCLNENLALMAFIVGIVVGLINFIMMIIFIVEHKTQAYIICLISMLLLPIIGFGCCAAGVSNMKF